MPPSKNNWRRAVEPVVEARTTVVLDEAHAPQMLAVLRFLRDTPGAEPLAIAYAAAYLKAAPAAAIM